MEQVLRRENASFAPGSLGVLSGGLMGLGVLFIAVTFIAGLLSGDGSDPASVKSAADGAAAALHAYHVGVMTCLGLVLGAMAFYMFNAVANAGWWVLIKKPFEHLMSLSWLVLLLFISVVVMQALFVNVQDVTTDKLNSIYSPFLWNWMDPYYTGAILETNPGLAESKGVVLDPLFEHKQGYLDLGWFWVRAILYFAIWIGLSSIIVGLSKRQERDGDKWHTLSLGRVCAAGLPFYGFATAFTAFDWLMTLDYHWFSTMFGVYYFAGSLLSALCLVGFTLIAVSTIGKMKGAFTVEHRHDLAKLVFGFTVFWAYITFSQYFLIWYAGIPEETLWFNTRKRDWGWLEWAIPIGHFIIPFLLLLPRPNRRSVPILAFACVWLFVFHILDLFWVIRPEVKGLQHIVWQDVVGVVGPVALFVGLYVRKLGSESLIPRHDPRSQEALEHKNFV
jgi:hypothetical protein